MEDTVTLVYILAISFVAALRESHPDLKDFDPIPRFVAKQTEYSFEAGELAVLKCEVENLGNKKVGWRKASARGPLTIGTMTFVQDSRVTVEHPPGTNKWNLIIKHVKPSDTGVYECQVSSSVRHLRYHVLLQVREADTKKKKDLDIVITGDPFVDKGEVIKLTCNATGREYPPEELDWFKNGNKMETNFAKKIYIRKMVSINSKTIISVLNIKKADLDDAGTYVCRTSDKQVTSKKVEVLNADTYNVRRVQEIVVCVTPWIPAVESSVGRCDVMDSCSGMFCWKM
ncbi:fibroblast growth factor receptor 4-like [Gigantopelta aegis]|uniref:fibroblast growth factor receptor 4-like n=1 Tax=Gigantopelta aegis TaxID=1735272 RepID=UPI001B88B1F4|nr:fibroblast growth factor receptor 4-like [Gigantopelta aegis]